MSILDLPERKRRLIIPALGFLLALCYLFILQPMVRNAGELDAPLDTTWRRLAVTLGRSNATTLSFAAITHELSETRRALEVAETAHQRLTTRIQLGEDIRARLREPFRLVDYQDERQRLIEDLTKLAKTRQVAIAPAVFAGFPEHTADVREPALLWAELTFVQHLLTSALNSQVSVLHALTVPLALTNAPPSEEPLPLLEVPVHLEFTALMPNARRFLASLPLRTEEIKAAGLPPAATNKPALFVDRLLVRKQSPDKPDEVRVWLRAVGYAPREPSARASSETE
jgi:hypothetical protein